MKENSRPTLDMRDKTDRKTMIMPTSEIMNKSSSSDGIVGIGAVVGGYKIIDIISENTGEAAVFLGEKDGIKRIIKLFHKNKKPKEEIIQKLLKTNCPYIVSYEDCGEHGEKFYAIMPYFSKGDVASLMPISEKELSENIIPCVAEGLKELHSMGIVHRDIKPGNIFISDDGKAVIGDFGISSVLDDNLSVRATGISRTLGYAAPETSAGFVSKASDYYSLGITLLHLVTGIDVFAGMTEMQILYHTLNKNIPIPRTVSPGFALLIRGLTRKDREHRFGYDKIKRWLAGEIIPEENSATYEKTADKSGFVFENKSYPDLVSLAYAFGENWEAALVYVYHTSAFETRLAAFSASLQREVAVLKDHNSPDECLFKVIMLLSPESPIFYRGRMFASLQAMGDEIEQKLPLKDNDIIDFVRSGCLKIYMEKKGIDSKVIERMEYIGAQFTLEKYEYYYALLYLLNRNYIYSDKFSDMKSLCDYLESLSDDEREEFSKTLVYDRLFHMWVFSKGYGKQLREWLLTLEEDF